MRALCLVMTLMALSACNTLAGAGEDLTVAGQALTQESRACCA